jgi:glycolate oxidase
VFGHAVRLPVVLSPIGSLSLADPDGASAVARAASQFGTVNFVSSVAKQPLEDVAASGTGPMVFQLYVRGDQAWIDAHLDRARAAGYVAVCITVDSAYYSRRDRDLIRGYLPAGRREGGGHEYQASLDWETLKRTIGSSPLPIILKGVTHPEDADLAVREGVRAIYVSNHGGRQLDHCDASIQYLPDVVAAVGDRAEVIVDGGILRGSDVLKALALGATAVGIGKLQFWALAAGGTVGVVRALELLEVEVRLAMALLGVRSISELSPAHLRRVAPVGPPGIASAFPQLPREFPDIR